MAHVMVWTPGPGRTGQDSSVKALSRIRHGLAVLDFQHSTFWGSRYVACCVPSHAVMAATMQSSKKMRASKQVSTGLHCTVVKPVGGSLISIVTVSMPFGPAGQSYDIVPGCSTVLLILIVPCCLASVIDKCTVQTVLVQTATVQ